MCASVQSYQLVIVLEAPTAIVVGRLGCFEFPAGRYIYTGSARRNLVARVARHFSSEKKLKWHIDFLLASPLSRLCDARFSREPECEWNQSTAGRIVVEEFGSSDCRSRCGSHLKFIGPDC